MKIIWINSDGFKYIRGNYDYVIPWNEVEAIFFNFKENIINFKFKDRDYREDDCKIEQYLELKKYYKNYKILSLAKELRKTDPISTLDHLVSNAKEIIDLEENLNPDKLLS